VSPESVVDVVVVAFESGDSLSRCLSSLPTECSAVVVDNASRDGGAELAHALGARVLRNDTNRGFAAAANQGAREGRAPLILFLNPDAAIEPAELRRRAHALELDDRLAAVGPRLVRDDGSEQRAWWRFPSPARTWAEALGLHRLRPDRPGPRGEVDFVVGACLLVRRRAFEQVGGFDERFWLYGEETDLCRRLRSVGWRVAFVPAAVARHEGGGSAAALGEATFEHFQRAAERFVREHHGASGLVLHRLGLLVGSLLRLPVLALSGSDDRLATRRAIVARLARELLG
jgi:GT2 family glycosyltransferase